MQVSGVVTAVASPRFFIQVPEADRDATLGATYSGLYVYLPSTVPTGLSVPAQGDMVSVTGAVDVYYGQIELSSVSSINVLSNGNTLPAPAVVSAADVGTTGLMAEDYEGVLVTVESATVTELNPSAHDGDSDPTNEFVLDSALRVNDLMYRADPMPMVNDVVSVTGILRWANADSKLELRSADDLVFVQTASPELQSFAPAMVYIDAGSTTAQSIPPLMLTLNRPAPAGGVDISLHSNDLNVLVVTDSINIPEGDTQIEVLLTGVAASDTPVTLDATLDDTTLNVQVLVMDPARTPTPDYIDPNEMDVSIGQVKTLSVYLSQPAPAGGTVVSLSASPDTMLTIPDSVTVTEGNLAADFDITALETVGDVTLTATANGSDANTLIHVVDMPSLGLILSEVYYDHPDNDSGYEWIEIYNGTGSAVDLSTYSLANAGNDYTYGTYQLSGTLEVGGCFVIGGPQGTASYDQSMDFDPDIQNSGSTADAVALFNVTADQITNGTVPIDAVIYGGSNSNNLLDESGSAGNVDVGDAPATNSIERTAEGWRIQSTPTPNDCTALLP